MSRLMFVVMLIVAALGLGTAHCVQAGIMPEQTRLIIHEGDSQRSLMLANTNTYPVVVQTWIDNGEGTQAPENASNAMLALPSVFRMQPGAVQGLRIVYDGSPQPKDRESVSWLNIYEIPPTKTEVPLATTQVAVAMNTQMKVFYRPANLPSSPEKMAAALTFSIERRGNGWVLLCHNPTPFHASFSSLRLSVQGRELPVSKTLDMMAPPLSDKVYALDGFNAGAMTSVGVNYTLIDDGGHYQDGVSQAPIR
ncbi:fimbrial biogenesis chaperone [Pseudomonas helleri]|uniref:fimbrial biogenesis chaperone n=1 Tax=Pseudomonas helleri TaxID=1608996 RepID=UPI00333E2273